jgi:hypothetical protein
MLLIRLFPRTVSCKPPDCPILPELQSSTLPPRLCSGSFEQSARALLHQFLADVSAYIPDVLSREVGAEKGIWPPTCWTIWTIFARSRLFFKEGPPCPPSPEAPWQTEQIWPKPSARSPTRAVRQGQVALRQLNRCCLGLHIFSEHLHHDIDCVKNVDLFGGALL